MLKLSQKFHILKSFFTTISKNLNQKQAYQIVFFGSDKFSVASLKALINESSMLNIILPLINSGYL